ncbi:hypothetical protein EDD15DRAFT_1937974 [Pisolithus albus]|nr:hypothetical protein EDD15DRAFT_1937974 [Pisolithus albus]
MERIRPSEPRHSLIILLSAWLPSGDSPWTSYRVRRSRTSVCWRVSSEVCNEPAPLSPVTKLLEFSTAVFCIEERLPTTRQNWDDPPPDARDADMRYPVQMADFPCRTEHGMMLAIEFSKSLWVARIAAVPKTFDTRRVATQRQLLREVIPVCRELFARTIWRQTGRSANFLSTDLTCHTSPIRPKLKFESISSSWTYCSRRWYLETFNPSRLSPPQVSSPFPTSSSRLPL